MTPAQFAQNEYRDYAIYRALAARETVPAFKRILEELVEHERGDFEFWRRLAPPREYRLGPGELLKLRAMRRLLGLTFTAKYLERYEQRAIRDYRRFLETAEGEMRARVQAILDHETYHETALINKIQEERVKFLGSIVLGINDGLIELTGALTGFTFALRDARLVALFGLVTGISATLSMASSAYMQARHEPGKDPRKASIYTGVSYLFVVSLLVLPFLAIPRPFAALGCMMAMTVVLIAAFSGYASVLFERNFRRQFNEMLVFSLGVAVIAFGLGTVVRRLLGTP